MIYYLIVKVCFLRPDAGRDVMEIGPGRKGVDEALDKLAKIAAARSSFYSSAEQLVKALKPSKTGELRELVDNFVGDPGPEPIEGPVLIVAASKGEVPRGRLARLLGNEQETSGDYFDRYFASELAKRPNTYLLTVDSSAGGTAIQEAGISRRYIKPDSSDDLGKLRLPDSRANSLKLLALNPYDLATEELGKDFFDWFRRLVSAPVPPLPAPAGTAHRAQS